MFQLETTFYDIMDKIEKENKLEKLFEIEDEKELYNFFKENGYSKSESEFKAERRRLIEEASINLEESELDEVAGGSLKNNLTKLTSASMASLLMLGASPISSKAHASSGYYFADSQPIAVQKFAKKDNSKTKKVILAALGVGGLGLAGAGGLGIYLLCKNHCKNKGNVQVGVNNLKKDATTAVIATPIEEEVTPSEDLIQKLPICRKK